MTDNFSRRDFLKWMSAGAGAAAAGGAIWISNSGHAPEVGGAVSASEQPSDTSPPGTEAPQKAQTPTAVTPISDVERRTLVVIELDGGNDGLSTLVPYGLPGYYDLRTTTALAAGDVLALDDEVGWHPSLSRVSAHGLAVVEGVGSWKPDGSHFEMMRRWWSGDNDGSAGYPTGFLGRLADVIGDPAAPAAALTIGSGNHPALLSQKVSTLALPSVARRSISSALPPTM